VFSQECKKTEIHTDDPTPDPSFLLERARRRTHTHTHTHTSPTCFPESGGLASGYTNCF